MEGVNFGEVSDPPIGVASVAAYLEADGHEVIVVDGWASGLSNQEIVKRVEQFKAEYVGISCNYCTLHNSTLQLARLTRAAMGSRVPIFVGGNHATALSEYLLSQGRNSIDCIIRGEGEKATQLLIEALAAGQRWEDIASITFLAENGAVIRTRDIPLADNLDDFPIPAYHLLPMDVYKRYNIISARGCPFGCTFCASTVLFSRRVRYRSALSIRQEIEYLLRNYGDRQFWFSDDTFTSNRKHTVEMLSDIIDHDLNIKWSCLTTVNTVSPEVLALMKKAGCQWISYGVETGHNAFLKKYIRKPIDCKGIIETSKLTTAHGLPHYGFFIFGFPGESWETVYDTYDLILKSHFNGGAMNILIPLPGTELWNELYSANKYFRLDEIQWDQLFARMPSGQETMYTAELAARWCELGPAELVEACKVGQRLFPFAAHVKLAGSSNALE